MQTEIKERNYLWNESVVDLLQDVVHLQQFGLDEWTVRSTDMTNVVQAKVVEDENVPVISLKGTIQVTGYVVVDLCQNKRFKTKQKIL